MQKAVLLVCLAVFLAGSAHPDSRQRKGLPETLPVEVPVEIERYYRPAVPPDPSSMNTVVGTFTTLSGFYDYQSNGGAVQHIRVNPANGNIHVTYMLSEDSTAPLLNSRRTGYAFSTDGGASWNNFGNTRVPNRTSGFPSIDIGRGGIAGSPIIANHATVGSTNFSIVNVDVPEGSGAFAELVAPPSLGGTLEPIWPYVGCASDGSIIIAASQNDPNNNLGVVHHNRTTDYISWPAWITWPDSVQSGGRHVVQTNGAGRAGILLNTSNGTGLLGNRWRESTNNGATWTAPVNLYGSRIAGADTFNSYVHADFLYDGNTPLFIFSEYYVPADRDEDNLVFWSQATGFRIAVPQDTSKYGPYNLNPNPQRFHNRLMNFPSIGMSGSTIVVAYQAFQPDTDAYGFNYSDLWYVTSSNGGNAWSQPTRITNTPNTDERYPSVSKWNAPGEFNIVWSQKTPGHSGLFAFPGPDGARGVDTVRTFQMFQKISLTTGVDDKDPGLAQSFKLSQNYPNPFNPATRIDYTVAKAGPVSIKVYNMLGQEVATLVDQHVAPGTYQVTFDASSLPSGVYVYRMFAPSASGSSAFVESRKMILLR